MSTATRETTQTESIGHMAPLFPLGTISATPCALETIRRAGSTPVDFILRHVRGEWLEMSPDDIEANTGALRDGGRILSAYTVGGGERLFVITEADRSTTTLLLSDEY